MRAICLGAFLAGSLFAGQSLVLTNNSATNGSVTAQPVEGDCTVEFYLHDWDPAQTAGTFLPDNACGVSGKFAYFPHLTLYMYWTRGSGGNQIYFDTTSLPSKRVYARFVVYGEKKWISAEFWDENGVRVQSGYDFYSSASGSNPNGFTLQGTDAVKSFAVGFAKIKNVGVPFGAAMPSSFDNANTIVNWKLDGNGADASGNGFTATVNGTPGYVSQVGQTLVVANVGTAIRTGYGTNYPVYNRSGWVAMRAAHSNTLDLSQSVSQADSGGLTYNLSVSGPSAPLLTGATTANPSIDSCVFGDYTFHLTVTDGAAQSGTVDQHIGCVAYGANGVVSQSNTDVTAIFGPMIAYGQSPWAKMDERQFATVGLQTDYFNRNSLNPPAWTTAGQGTVTYPFAGIGTGYGQAGTTLHTSIGPTDTSIVVEDAARLPALTTLPGTPTWITLGNAYGTLEKVRICSTTGTTGQQTLTVCYDGRGLSGMRSDGSETIAPQPWPAGTGVGEYRIAGSGTRFGTDANRPLCPAGLPGPPGAVISAAGTVTLTGSSTTVTGSGTAFASDMIGGFIRITATHSSGTAFVYWSRIGAVTDATRLTVDRALPADVDAGPFSYKITGQRWVSLEFAAADGATQRGLQGLTGCESETAAFARPLHDSSAYNTTTQTGVKYSYQDALGMQSAFGPNFYGSGLALRAFYYRSGLQAALDAANIIDENWIRGPEIGAGWFGGGMFLLTGGGVVGAIADLVLNPSTVLTWKDVRQYAAIGARLHTSTCNQISSRDGAYAGAQLILASLFDPDPAQRAAWISDVQQLLAYDQGCKQTDNSWSNAEVFYDGYGPQVTPVNGSATVTGAAIPSTACAGMGQGTATLTNGSASITAAAGTFAAGSTTLFLDGTMAGQPLHVNYQFTRIDSTHGTLAVLWPGDSGTVTWMDTNSGEAYQGYSNGMMTIARNEDDPQTKKNWECIWNNSSQITLDRPWDTATTGNYYLKRYNLIGFGQQPYMLGMKTVDFRWGSLSSNSSIAAGYTTLRSLASTWVHDYGYDPATKGLFYGRVFEACEPPGTPPPGSNNTDRSWNCAYGLDSNLMKAARVLTAEVSSALYGYYDAQGGSTAAREWGDQAYGATWGFPPWTKAGLYSDAYWVRDELLDTQLGSYKWPGFFFGMGAAHQWPAVRKSLSAPGADTASTALMGVMVSGRVAVE